MSTSSSAVYYGGRHRFYTGDLTQSFPVYKNHDRAWTLKTYDNFGTHASTTVDGKTLKLYNWGSTSTPQYEAGYWLSDPWDLSSITNVEGSFIEYCACARNGADVIVKTAITTSTSTEPVDADFVVATSTTAIPGIIAGDNLYGKYLWLKIEMEPNWTATGTPCLCRINLAINDVATTTSAHNALQSLSYTYDAVGNITKIEDLSGFGGHKTVNYTYDDLYRLLTASTTVPANNGYNQTFTYDRVGNILTSPEGTYIYGETGFTNPHGATAIGGTSLTYDDNGNVTDFGNDDYAWNYRDRLVSSTVGGTLALYGYDFNNDRVTKGNGTATTTYANKYYNVLGATTTKHIFDNNGTLLATIEGNGNSTSTNFIHTDHLGSTDIVVDEDGDVVEETDYFPYGAQRINDSKTGFVEQRKHTGNEYDTENNLTYGEARYRDQDIGKWFAIDPASRDNPVQFLEDPQQFNMYSYGRNNPLILVDTTGKASTRAWLLNPGGTALQVGLWRTGAFLASKFGFGGTKYPLTQELVQHSTSLNPVTYHAGPDSDFARAIQKSNEYQKAVKEFMGDTKQGNQKDSYRITFKSGDLLTSLHDTTATFSGEKVDGVWNISSTITDRYDYKLENYDSVLRTANNAGLVSQTTGTLSNFDVQIDVKGQYNEKEDDN